MIVSTRLPKLDPGEGCWMVTTTGVSAFAKTSGKVGCGGTQPTITLLDGRHLIANVPSPTVPFGMHCCYRAAAGSQPKLYWGEIFIGSKVKTHFPSQKMTMAASVIAPMKMSAQLSYRVAIRL